MIRFNKEFYFSIALVLLLLGAVVFSRSSIRNFEGLMQEEVAENTRGAVSYEALREPIKRYARNVFVASEFIILLFLAGGIALFRQRRTNFDLAIEAKAASEWRETFDAITDLISIHERDFVIVRVNKALVEAFGRGPEKFVGTACHELFHGAHEPVKECPHRRTIATGKPAREEFFNARLNRWLEISTSPVFDSRGKVVRTVHIAKDITLRKKSEESVRLLTKFLDDIIQSVPLGMFVVAEDGRIEYANKAMLRMIGASTEQARDSNVFTYAPYVELGLDKKIRAALRGESFYAENVTVTSGFDGRLTTRNIAGIPMPGERSKALIIAEDVTYKREVEKMKRLAELGKFVGDTAHFIDNPLMVIMGSAEMSLLEDAPAGEVRENLRIIIRECERAKNIIRGLRQFADPGRHDMVPLDVHLILEDIFRDCLTEWKKCGIEARLSRGTGVPLAILDAAGMKRALMQIFLNAKEAMPGGGMIEIKTSLDDAMIRIDIKDSGAGMSQKVLDHIFDPFFTTVEGKPGLGVSVAYGIIRDHGGDLKYASRPGEGTVASVFLPAA